MVRNRPQPVHRRSFLSLFCGCGGLDSGFINEGFQCVGAVDNDIVAVRTHAANFDAPTFALDLSKANSDIANFSGVDVVLAGPPCQGFSTLGKRDIDDPRNSLLVHSARIAVELKPRVVVIENVPGALAGEHGRFWAAAKELLVAGGYGLAEAVVDAQDFGVAQTRRRVILIGCDRGRTATLPAPQSQRAVLRHVLPASSSNSKLTGDALLIARAIRPGQKLCNVRGGPRSVPTWCIPEVFGKTSQQERSVLEAIRSLRRQSRSRTWGDADPVNISDLEERFGSSTRSILRRLAAKHYVKFREEKCDLTHTFNGKYRRLDWNSPSPTVDTRFGSPRYFLHPDEDRGLTTAEAAAIQSFPSEFRFLGAVSAQYRMIGNAVPPLLSSRLAATVRDYIL